MNADLLTAVVKEPGEPARIVYLTPENLRRFIGDATDERPFNMLGTQAVVFDDHFVAKGLAPNIMHPMYRSYYELCGPVVIVGVDRASGGWRSLDTREAQQIVARLGELAVSREHVRESGRLRGAYDRDGGRER